MKTLHIGIIVFLIFVVLLSQRKMYDFLTNTILGRVVVVSFVVGISCTNKIVGIISVLYLIILINNNQKPQMWENFTTKQTEQTKQTKQTKLKQIPTEGREGFNIIEREGTIQRGKQSNEIPVFSDARNHNEDVEPVDKNVFTNSFYSF